MPVILRVLPAPHGHALPGHPGAGAGGPAVAGTGRLAWRRDRPRAAAAARRTTPTSASWSPARGWPRLAIDLRGHRRERRRAGRGARRRRHRRPRPARPPGPPRRWASAARRWAACWPCTPPPGSTRGVARRGGASARRGRTAWPSGWARTGRGRCPPSPPARPDGVARGYWHATGDDRAPWAGTFALATCTPPPVRPADRPGGRTTRACSTTRPCWPRPPPSGALALFLTPSRPSTPRSSAAAPVRAWWPGARRWARVRRRAFAGQEYWARPVPGLRRPRPVADGRRPRALGPRREPHRRVFTGDPSGDVLFAALHRAGIASQPHSVSRGDGMRLYGARVAAAVRCVPPDNRPTPEERDRCRPYLVVSCACCPRSPVLLALAAVRLGRLPPRPRRPAGPWPRFSHGAEASLGNRVLLGSYHPARRTSLPVA
jgi:uracil-DNA glycosylase